MSIVSTMDSKRATDEVVHANEDLQHFYMEAKRNKFIALWAAEMLKLDPREYFLELEEQDISKAGPKPVIDRILQDFEANNIKISEDEVWEKLRECERKAFYEMFAKFNK